MKGGVRSFKFTTCDFDELVVSYLCPAFLFLFEISQFFSDPFFIKNQNIMKDKCDDCGMRNRENCNTCPDMEPIKNQVVQISGTAYPKNEFFWKQKHPKHWECLQGIKALVNQLTLGEVSVHFRYPETAGPKIINKPKDEKDKTQN